MSAVEHDSTFSSRNVSRWCSIRPPHYSGSSDFHPMEVQLPASYINSIGVIPFIAYSALFVLWNIFKNHGCYSTKLSSRLGNFPKPMHWTYFCWQVRNIVFAFPSCKQFPYGIYSRFVEKATIAYLFQWNLTFCLTSKTYKECTRKDWTLVLPPMLWPKKVYYCRFTWWTPIPSCMINCISLLDLNQLTFYWIRAYMI